MKFNANRFNNVHDHRPRLPISQTLPKHVPVGWRHAQEFTVSIGAGDSDCIWRTFACSRERFIRFELPKKPARFTRFPEIVGRRAMRLRSHARILPADTRFGNQKMVRYKIA